MGRGRHRLTLLGRLAAEVAALVLIGLAAVLLLLLLVEVGLAALVLTGLAAGVLAFVKITHDLILSYASAKPAISYTPTRAPHKAFRPAARPRRLDRPFVRCGQYHGEALSH